MVRPKDPWNKPPPGLDVVLEDGRTLNAWLDGLDTEMREHLATTTAGRLKTQTGWNRSKISRRRTRLVYRLHFVENKISRELFEWLCEEGHSDRPLALKWNHPGYEALCCTSCIKPSKGFGTTCVCRVPPRDRADGPVECRTCGCTGCVSGKKKPPKREEMAPTEPEPHTETYDDGPGDADPADSVECGHAEVSDAPEALSGGEAEVADAAEVVNEGLIQGSQEADGEGVSPEEVVESSGEDGRRPRSAPDAEPPAKRNRPA